jgi:hypothetical protein
VGAKLPRYDIVEDGFEIVEKYGVRGAFEHECEAPVRINSALCDEMGGTDDDVGEEKGNGEKHASEHDAEASVDAD